MENSIEQNTSLFIIQRSADGRSFVDIASIPTAGNSSSLLNYEFSDAAPFRGTGSGRLIKLAGSLFHL